MLLKLEDFEYATSLDLNMGYNCIRFIEEAINICAILIPWEKYRYKRLTMGVINSLDIFQDKMNEMFNGFEFIQAYIYDLMIIAKDDWSNHLDQSSLAIIIRS